MPGTARSPQKGRRDYRKSGLYSARRTLNEYGLRALDGRSATGQALAKWRRAVEDDLGGPEAVSVTKRALLDLAARQKLLLDSVDSYLLNEGERAILDKRSKTIRRVVRDRQSLADALARYLGMLGLEKRRAQPTLVEYLEKKRQEAAQASQDATGGGEEGDPS